MKELLWISQAVIILFTTEKYLRENKNWNKIYTYLEQGTVFFLNWRADADIIYEMKMIPELFKKLSLISFALILLSVSIGAGGIIIYLMYFIGISIIIIFSFNWVFNHRDTIKEFKSVAYLFGFIGAIILISIFYNNFYPTEIITLANNSNVVLPDKYELALSFLFMFILILLSYYVFMWIVTLAIPISILVILFSTTKTSKILKTKFNKKSVNGFIGILQLLVLYGFYKIS